MLSRDEIGREPAKLIYQETRINGIPVIRHEMFTSGIGYLKVLFDTNRVPMEDLPYVGLLKSILGYVSTSRHSYDDLSSEIFLNSGGVTFFRYLLSAACLGRLYRRICRQRSGALRKAGLWVRDSGGNFQRIDP